ncbi:MAG: hypothetical protein U0R44_00670 [Candidatus Micrarchaeia archaeon]
MVVKARTFPSAQSDIQSIRHFYSRVGAPNQYVHGHEVYSTAARVDIIEEDIVRNKREDPGRRQANLTLRRLALAHSLDHSKLSSTDERVPDALRDERFLEELEIYGKLTDLERSGATKAEYEPLLNNGKRPLSLLIKLADYAVTHDTEDQLEGFIYNGSPSLVRQYSSVGEARIAMKMDAKAGEFIYAPIAELFGYPELAGEIFLHAFKVNHRDIYNHVQASMEEKEMRHRMAMTQFVVSELAKVLSSVFKAYGFEAEVQLRKEKHDGKKMKKMLNYLRSDYERSETRHIHTFEEYAIAHIPSFDFERFNDWVAVRVILKRFRGTSIDELISDQQESVERGTENGRERGVDIRQINQLLDSVKVPQLKLAVKLISDTITSLGGLFSQFVGDYTSDALYYEKKNGYRGFHFDTRVVRGGDNAICSLNGGRSALLPFEVQLKTPEWHNIAEHGLAAHYYYLGGDNDFVNMIRDAYHDIIHPPEQKPNGRSGPQSRRPSILPPQPKVSGPMEPEPS